jgi:hypothetical protein
MHASPLWRGACPLECTALARLREPGLGPLRAGASSSPQVMHRGSSRIRRWSRSRCHCGRRNTACRARVEAQVQLDFIARAHQLLELQHFHAGEFSGRFSSCGRGSAPIRPAPRRATPGLGEVAAEVGQVRWHAQLQAPLAVGFDLLQHLWGFRPWRQQQCFDVGLGQLALAVQRQLAQQAPAPGQGQRFAMLAQVLAQGFGQAAAAVLRKACRPSSLSTSRAPRKARFS